VSVTLSLGGLPVVVSDTAGLRAVSDDAVEVEGMARAAAAAKDAHVQLWVLDASDDASRMSEGDDGDSLGAMRVLGGDEGPGEGHDGPSGDRESPRRLLVLNKSDLVDDDARSPAHASALRLFSADRRWSISCATGDGLAEFIADLGDVVSAARI